MDAVKVSPAGSLVVNPKQPQVTIEEKDAPTYPIHPIPELQGAFEESIQEANQKGSNEWVVEIDAQTRRRDLLENDEYERICGRKWRQKGSEK